jgi:hypothetical protein
MRRGHLGSDGVRLQRAAHLDGQASGTRTWQSPALRRLRLAAKKKKAGPVVATPEELEKFQEYLFEMDDVLEVFIEEARQAGVTLDYSEKSLDAIEPYLKEKLAAEGNRDGLRNQAGRYVGETFRKLIGGKWELCLKAPNYLYFKLPVISGYSAEPIEFCPNAVVDNFLGWQKPGTLKRAFAAHEEYKLKAT